MNTVLPELGIGGITFLGDERSLDQERAAFVAVGVFYDAIAQHVAGICIDRLKPPVNENFDPHRPAKKAFRDMTNEERRAAIAENPDYARIVCRCEMVTEAEIRDAIRRPLGARSISEVKLRTRAGMGRCQGGFCSPRVLEILSEELGISPLEVTQCGGSSRVLAGLACNA